MFNEELKDTDFWPAWRLVQNLTLREAALLFSGLDPAQEAGDYGSNYRAYSTALLEAVHSNVLPVLMLRYQGGVYGRAERVEGDPLTHVAASGDLASWAKANGVPHYWKSTQSTLTQMQQECFPLELRVAISAYEAVSVMDLANKTPKEALKAWIEENYGDALKTDQKERVAIVANWSKGGPRKTPSGRAAGLGNIARVATGGTKVP